MLFNFGLLCLCKSRFNSIKDPFFFTRLSTTARLKAYFLQMDLSYSIFMLPDSNSICYVVIPYPTSHVEKKSNKYNSASISGEPCNHAQTKAIQWAPRLFKQPEEGNESIYRKCFSLFLQKSFYSLIIILFWNDAMPSHHHSNSASVANWNQVTKVKKIVTEYPSEADTKAFEKWTKDVGKMKICFQFYFLFSGSFDTEIFLLQSRYKSDKLHKQCYSEKQRSRFWFQRWQLRDHLIG